MVKFHKIWKEQCEAAQGIRESFGVEKALGYLIGEKLINFLKASETDPEFEQEIPAFVTEIKSIFQPWEIEKYFEGMPRMGALAHCCTDEKIEDFRQAGALPDNPSQAVRDLQVYNQARELLLN